MRNILSFLSLYTNFVYRHDYLLNWIWYPRYLQERGLVVMDSNTGWTEEKNGI